MNEDNKISLVNAYAGSWKRCFDYKGKSSKQEYWCVVVVDIVLAVVTAMLLIVGKAADIEVITIVGMIFSVCLIVSMLPLLSLTIRRLHDTGKSGWWMFLIFVVLVGAIALMLMCSQQSEESELADFAPVENIPVAVYGPPEMLEEQYGIEPDEIDEDGNMIFYPSENANQLVYGPPEMMEELTNEAKGEEATDEVKDEEASSDEKDISDSDKEVVFDESVNVNVDVYGPPSFFDNNH